MDVVATYLEQVVARLRSLLGRELVGIYAGGSWALGSFRLIRSDLDVAAVSAGPVAEELKMRIAVDLRHESLPCPARGLEFVLYPVASVREATAEAGFELNLNTGPTMRFTLETDAGEAPPHWYVIDRAILRAHGRALLGPSPHVLFAPIPRASLLRALVESVRWHVNNEARRDDDAVLNACRAWRFADDGVWSSKLDAGRWADARLEDPSLVTHALELYSEDGRLDRGQVQAFLEGVRRRLESASA